MEEDLATPGSKKTSMALSLGGSYFWLLLNSSVRILSPSKSSVIEDLEMFASIPDLDKGTILPWETWLVDFGGDFCLMGGNADVMV